MKPMENSCGVPGAPNPCAVMLMRDSNMASLPSKPDEVMRSAKRAAGGRRRRRDSKIAVPARSSVFARGRLKSSQGSSQVKSSRGERAASVRARAARRARARIHFLNENDKKRASISPCLARALYITPANCLHAWHRITLYLTPRRRKRENETTGTANGADDRSRSENFL